MFLILGLSAIVISLSAFPLLLIVLYLFHVNQAFKRTPKEAARLSPKRWTKEEVRQTYERVCREPIDFNQNLPPKQQRRYVVVGGSGLVGGEIIAQLLGRGQAPEGIRIVDLRPPQRSDLLTEQARKMSFVQTDITSSGSVSEAFAQPWPPGHAALPLTVFHTAAVIRFSERARSLLSRSTSVNTVGTANVLSAARSAGADIFIATSSAAVALRRVSFWLPPWRSMPKGYFQLYPPPEKDGRLRPHDQYFGNYAVSKAEAENIVCEANSRTFRTGCIRPASGIYSCSNSTARDLTIGTYLRMANVATWVEHVVQNFVSSSNVAMAHLDFEAAILRQSHSRGAGGKSFVVTDPNPPITFADIYLLISTLSVTDFSFYRLQPVMVLLLAHVIEAYCVLLAYFPFLTAILREPTGNLQLLQPALFAVGSVHQVATDAEAKQSIEAGGLGYKPICTTLEGLCMQLMLWNQDHGSKVKEPGSTSPRRR